MLVLVLFVGAGAGAAISLPLGSIVSLGHLYCTVVT